MTKTQTDAFKFIRNGTAYNGSPLWDVNTPSGRHLGSVAKSKGKRGTTWVARYLRNETYCSCGGFSSREVAARFLRQQAS